MENNKFKRLETDRLILRRLVQQGAVRINGVKTNALTFDPFDGMIIQVGKGNVFKLEKYCHELELSKRLQK